MVDDDLARLRDGVWIAAPLQQRDDPSLGPYDNGCAAGIAGLELHRAPRGALGLRVGRSALPLDRRLPEPEPWAWRDADQRRRRVSLADVGLDAIGVVAFRSQDRDGVLGGGARAAARLETRLDPVVRVADRALDCGAQIAVQLALDNGARFGGESHAMNAQGRRSGKGVEQSTQSSESQRAPQAGVAVRCRAVTWRDDRKTGRGSKFSLAAICCGDGDTPNIENVRRK
ncbi:hypothetical protein [Phenylobacterium sp. J426]|uniref:hypothetical protein n=1 Tax=Phenylobacterium sp. J426 TaxID=2898439 RepID=UPI0027E38A4C|nr:hypothetical protein [Phenylobacterium sp. J426]